MSQILSANWGLRWMVHGSRKPPTTTMTSIFRPALASNDGNYFGKLCAVAVKKELSREIQVDRISISYLINQSTALHEVNQK